MMMIDYGDGYLDMFLFSLFNIYLYLYREDGMFIVSVNIFNVVSY